MDEGRTGASASCSNIVIYGSCTIIKMKTTVVVQAGVQQHFSLNSTWYAVYKSTVLNKYGLLVADGNTTFLLSRQQGERSSTKIRMDCGIADKTCVYFGSAA